MSLQPEAQAAAGEPPAPPGYSLKELLAYFLMLGALGFGGPVALVGYMHRDLVERRRWISDADYKEGLALAQLAPGPLAAQLAIYLGYVHYRILGATLVSIAFVLPSFVMVVALGWAYKEYGRLSWMQEVFYGIGPAVIGIISFSAYKLTRKTIGGDWLLWVVYLASAACTIVTESEVIWLFLGAGLLVWAAKTPFRRTPPQGVSLAALPLAAASASSLAAHAATTEPSLATMFWFFAKAGAFVFGSGLAVVPFLYGGVVHDYGWLTEQEFLDAVAVAMITPGPVVITVGFIGYLKQELAGATVAALGVFMPCYLFTILPAPYFKKYGRRPGIVAFVDGVTAAATGAIAGSVVVLGRRTLLVDHHLEWTKAIVFVATLAVVVSFRKIPEPLIVLAAGLIGLLILR